ncbi:WD40-repeat-containing domain protein [Thamnocephalis sphaerospora]|uniref:Pre-mRNA-processing factor 19 n=1 Tax=Thamnocephalis sphaerospora TaxID=78915 RepID=A0A4P9XR39_9FUNG|nr:WD40-repeat-containing domain protein [Thamnocephalis sphaerospora]|eukprot:RKP08382.1 WD40-repeat-containing domain protein [Thamnocephalis sphaerospora]
MFCAISGETPQEPVVATTSGLVFEKRLIIKYLADHGKCPVTGEELTEKDLVDVKIAPKMVKPRPPTLVSLPSLLATFQNEWDSMMLEVFSLKQQYQQVRQELSHALYQHDAACRVIARLVKERDAARSSLATIQMQLNAPAPASAAAPAAEATSMDVDQPAAEEVEGEGLGADIADVLDATAKELSKTRKKRKAPAELASADAIRGYKMSSTVPSMHSSTAPGVNCMDIRGQLVLTGGVDKQVMIYARNEEKVLATLKGHTKRVNEVAFFGGGSTGLTEDGELDSDLGVNKPGVFKSHLLKMHTADVVGVSVHPSQQYVASAGADAQWALSDLGSVKNIFTLESEDSKDGFASIRFHPDGLILATGTNDGVVRVWDVKSRQNVASFTGHTGSVGALAFSENGYYLATADATSPEVKLWDLRKLSNFASIQLPEEHRVESLGWDRSGQYLAVGGSDLRVYQNKTWELLGSWDDNTAEVTGVGFGELAQEVVSVSKDRCFRAYA